MTTTPDGRLLIGRAPEPFEIGALLLAFTYGVLCTIRYDLAATSIREYPGVGGRVFVGLLALGALVALTGVMNRSLWGIRLESAGLTIIGCLGAAYALWAPFSIGLRGLGLILFLGVLLAGPSMWVVLRLRRYIKAAEQLKLNGARPEEGKP